MPKWLNKLVEKQNVIDRALDTETKGIKKVEGKVEGTAASYDAATHNFGHDRLGQIANKLDAEKIALVHSAVRQVASMCDGAVQEDTCGFNRLDARIGRDLAMNDSLSHRQAALGLVMVLKYHRQLGTVVTESLKSIMEA